MCHEVALWEPAAVLPLRYAATKKALTVFFEKYARPTALPSGGLELHIIFPIVLLIVLLIVPCRLLLESHIGAEASRFNVKN